MATFNCPYNPMTDYFAVLGVHQQACPQTVKQAYRRLARRYHPDVSKLVDAQQKFQQISEAYEVLHKHREAYWRDFVSHSAAFKQDKPSNRAHHTAHHSKSAKEPAQKRSQTKQADGAQRGFFYHSTRTPRPIDGKDRFIVYPLTLRYAIRLLRLGTFYIPGLQVKMKFTREALSGKTFRLRGKGYSGLFGGRAGDYLVRFEIKQEGLQWQLKGADIYATFTVCSQLLSQQGPIRLDSPSGACWLELPKDYMPTTFIKIENMGLPPDALGEAGHLYARLVAA